MVKEEVQAAAQRNHTEFESSVHGCEAGTSQVGNVVRLIRIHRSVLGEAVNRVAVRAKRLHQRMLYLTGTWRVFRLTAILRDGLPCEPEKVGELIDRLPFPGPAPHSAFNIVTQDEPD